MLTFESDYTNGCHEDILKAFYDTNSELVSGYGNDKFCKSAEKKILEACGLKNGAVEFVTGGTQTNQLVIDSLLDLGEGVIAARTGHINCHEAGAIEYTGHKVIELPQYNGKLKASDVASYLEIYYKDDNKDAVVIPSMVYISHPTEYGTLYSLSELTDLHNVCEKYNIPLFIDGARLGYGLASRNTDVTLKDIARLSDVFYIGGTKVGALCGEAVVFTHGNRPARFFSYKKMHGALLAKGRVLGVQFDTLFTNDLYMRISRNAIDMAEKLKAVLKKHGFEFFLETDTNQQFVVLEDSYIKKLSKYVGFGFWETVDSQHTAVRFATSWATTQEQIDQLDAILSSVK